MPNPPNEPSDNQMYYGLLLYADTFRFVLKSLRFYLGLLEASTKEPQLDDDLRELLDEKPRRASLLDEETGRVRRIIDWYESEEKKAGPDSGDYEIGNLSHGTVRYTKSVGLLYMKHLRQKRNLAASRPKFPKQLLEEIDSQLAKYEEKF